VSDASRCADRVPRGPPALSLFATPRLIRTQAEFDKLLAGAREGRVQRVALRAEGTSLVACDCPPFMLMFPDRGSSAFEILSPVAREGVLDIGHMRTHLRYVLVGYLSGAFINTYERFRAMKKDPGTPDHEQRQTWNETFAEFCLEAWCFTEPPIPPSSMDPEALKYHRDRVADGVDEMKKLGASRCRY
jgi:hypothetical protein